MNEGGKLFPTLQEIRDAHTWKRDYERYLPLSRYVYRPLGFLVTWVAIRIGITTEMASFISAILGITGLFFLLCKNYSVIIGGIMLLHLFNLFDCVDGSIARATNTQNPYGKFLDSVIGDVINFAFFAVVGIMLFCNPFMGFLYSWNPQFTQIMWLAIGGGASFFYVTLVNIEGLYNAQLKQKWKHLSVKSGPISADDIKNESIISKKDARSAKLINAFRIIDRNLRVRETHYFLLLFAYCLHFVDLFLIFYLIFFGIRSLVSAILFGNRAMTLRNHMN
jgi:phosphatidylglycerophosphate synthase